MRINICRLSKSWNLLACGLVLASLTLAGCGGGETGPKMHTVNGTVTFDGNPVEKGRIQFRSIDGGKAYSSEIVEGKYSLQAEAGEVKVEIVASRNIPGKFDNSNPDEEPQPVGEMYIPAKYNTKSELTATIKEDGENSIPFDLKS